MRLFVALSMTTVLVLSTIAGCGSGWYEQTAPAPVASTERVRPYLEEKEQAAVAGVPESDPASIPVHAIMIMNCNKLLGLGFIDGRGGFHNVPLEGLTKAIVQDLLQSVPADQIDAYVVPCGAKDGTPI